MIKYTSGFISGIAYCIAWLIRNYECDMASDILKESGLTKTDFEQANIPEYDMNTIKDIL